VGTHAFGLTIEHLVDHSRSTPANGPDPGAVPGIRSRRGGR